MIVCESVSKSYALGHGRRTVLDNLSFTVPRGGHVGLLGRNGAGKSTLIRLLAGVELPDSGRIRRKMTMSWPLGLSGGFQGSLTGYDNARFIARIYGKRLADLKDFLEDFTELGRQLKMPVKTYSSGMRARLAFGLSLAIEFDCYLIDEVIMVGDQNFQRKCVTELFEKRADRALIFASHNLYMVRDFCQSALVLDKGRGTMFEDMVEAEAIYSAL